MNCIKKVRGSIVSAAIAANVNAATAVVIIAALKLIAIRVETYIAFVGWPAELNNTYATTARGKPQCQNI